ncbi:MAG: hypothetical protein ACR5K4_02140 [Sodalis sp. (in: enterobacteria)]
MSHSSLPAPRRIRRAQARVFIDTITGIDFSRSRRIYIQGQNSSVCVPMRERVAYQCLYLVLVIAVHAESILD